MPDVRRQVAVDRRRAARRRARCAACPRSWSPPPAAAASSAVKAVSAASVPRTVEGVDRAPDRHHRRGDESRPTPLRRARRVSPTVKPCGSASERDQLGPRHAERHDVPLPRSRVGRRTRGGTRWSCRTSRTRPGGRRRSRPPWLATQWPAQLQVDEDVVRVGAADLRRAVGDQLRRRRRPPRSWWPVSGARAHPAARSPAAGRSGGPVRDAPLGGERRERLADDLAPVAELLARAAGPSSSSSARAALLAPVIMREPTPTDAGCRLEVSGTPLTDLRECAAQRRPGLRTGPP